MVSVFVTPYLSRIFHPNKPTVSIIPDSFGKRKIAHTYFRLVLLAYLQMTFLRTALNGSLLHSATDINRELSFVAYLHFMLWLDQYLTKFLTCAYRQLTREYPKKGNTKDTLQYQIFFDTIRVGKFHI